MDWRYKAVLQSTLSLMPASHRLNLVFQRYVTKNLPAREPTFQSRVGTARRHVDLLREHLGHPLGEATFYEFGAGEDLIIPLALYAFGVNEQITVDIRRLASPALVNETIAKLQRLTLSIHLSRKPARLVPRGRNFVNVLMSEYGIDYQAPCDARRTGITTGTVDCITSSHTLEHIREQDIVAILAECHRVLRPDGAMSFMIDYQDHYSYFDRKVSAYNFLRYSDRRWQIFNPSLHYQNRLRHPDYLRLFHKSNFEVVAEYPQEGSIKDLETISHLPVASRFRMYKPSELAVRTSFIVLKRRSPDLRIGGK